MNNTDLYRFRKIALLEGWSLLILVFIAMPLKYFFDFPLAVKYVGWIHGILFILYGIYWLRCTIQYSWKITFAVLAMLVSFIPFGTFWLEKKLK